MSSSKGDAPFLSLPVELIQRIAIFCSYSTISNLLLVNRQLRATCTDKLVFEQIAQYDHINQGISSELWRPENLFERASRSDVARIASAVERACQLTKTQVPKRGHPRSSKVPQWLPHLLSLHHPASSRADVASLLGIILDLCATMPPGTDLRNIEYCFASTLLSTRPSHELSLGGILCSMLREEGAQDHFFSFMLSERMGFRTHDFHYLPDLIQPWLPITAIITLSAAIIQLGGLAHVPLPEPRRIPFHTLMEIPPILQNTSEAFSGCHLRAMTSVDFLSSGEWVGVYNDLRRRLLGGGVEDARFGLHDLPMVGMRFNCESLDPAHGRAGTRIIDSSAATDTFGTFQISGDIYENGTVRMRKHYTQAGWDWDWRGYVTPLGIAGVWGTVNSSIGGYFWIWKLDWCAPN